MLPFLTVFGIRLPMYSLMIAAGLFLGVFVAARFPVKKGIARQDILFASCYAGIGAFIGAKLLYLAIALPGILSADPPPAFSPELLSFLFSYGFVFYGGVAGGLTGVWLYARQYRFRFLALCETILPAVPLAHAFGRVGCFFAGCCYGLPAEPPWGVMFAPSSPAPHGVALFPVQLLESGLNLALFAGLFLYSRKERSGGRILGLYLAGYGVMRFLLEFLRYDAERGAVLGLSTSQWISLVLAPLGLWLLLRPSAGERRTLPGAEPF